MHCSSSDDNNSNFAIIPTIKFPQALESIFLSDFVKIDTSHVTIKLIPLQGEGDDVNFVGVTLDVVLPETYPEVVPQIDVVLDKGEGDQASVSEGCAKGAGVTVLDSARADLRIHSFTLTLFSSLPLLRPRARSKTRPNLHSNRNLHRERRHARPLHRRRGY